MNTFKIGSPVCPLCHSDVVKGYKVHANGEWWSRCISGEDHGVIDYDGERIDIGVDYHQIYFTDSGLVDYRGRCFTVLHQELEEVE